MEVEAVKNVAGIVMVVALYAFLLFLVYMGAKPLCEQMEWLGSPCDCAEPER